MKKIGYIIFGIIFRMFSVIPRNNKKVVLFMVHNSRFQGNLRYVYEEMKQEKEEFRFIILSKAELFHTDKMGMRKLFFLLKGSIKFYFQYNYHLATANYIFLNDNFLPLAYMPLKKGTKLVQLWHGVGALKRFGLATEQDSFVRKCVAEGNRQVTHVFVSSKQVVPWYAQALGISEEKIFSTGVPVTDFYFDQERRKKASVQFYEKYPQLKEKKLVLYTPTFRRTAEENQQILRHFDYHKVKEELGEEWAVLIRLHPQIHGKVSIVEEGCYDVTEYSDIKGLYEVSDVLINDYSSTMVEYALLDKPILLYAYDLEQYDRGFYRDYRENAPGIVVQTLEDLISALKEQKDDWEHRKKFIALQYDKTDGQAARRVVETVLSDRR